MLFRSFFSLLHSHHIGVSKFKLQRKACIFLVLRSNSPLKGVESSYSVYRASAEALTPLKALPLISAMLLLC